MYCNEVRERSQVPPWRCAGCTRRSEEVEDGKRAAERRRDELRARCDPLAVLGQELGLQAVATGVASANYLI